MSKIVHRAKGARVLTLRVRLLTSGNKREIIYLMNRIKITKKEVQKRLLDRVEYVGDCWLSTRGGVGEYTTICLSRTFYLTHRVAYWVYHEDPQDGVVCHKCDNPKCINPDHLFLGTQEDNMNDMANKGRACRGENQHMSKLTEEQVRCIKYHESGFQSEIAERYGVGQATISGIRSGKRWRHI